MRRRRYCNIEHGPPQADADAGLGFARLLRRDKQAKVDFLWDTAKAEITLRNAQDAGKRRSASPAQRRRTRQPSRGQPRKHSGASVGGRSEGGRWKKKTFNAQRPTFNIQSERMGP